jgi:hypothetical protein
MQTLYHFIIETWTFTDFNTSGGGPRKQSSRKSKGQIYITYSIHNVSSEPKLILWENHGITLQKYHLHILGIQTISSIVSFFTREEEEMGCKMVSKQVTTHLLLPMTVRHSHISLAQHPLLHRSSCLHNKDYGHLMKASFEIILVEIKLQNTKETL